MEGICEMEARKQLHDCKASLKAKVTVVVDDPDSTVVAKTHRWFWSRVEIVVKAEDGFIKLR